MPRELVWVKHSNFEGFGCSECQWVFKTSGALKGKTLDQMKQSYEAERDKAFACPIEGEESLDLKYAMEVLF
jgi:hypothetical protein